MTHRTNNPFGESPHLRKVKKMKLRNKKTGEIVECPMIRVSIGVCDGMCYEFPNSLAELIEEWEDYKPAEPLIEKRSHRGVLRAAARMSGTDIAHVSKSDFAEVVIFEFNGKELCRVELMDKGINIAHDGWYTIAVLCGEEEE